MKKGFWKLRNYKETLLRFTKRGLWHKGIEIHPGLPPEVSLVAQISSLSQAARLARELKKRGGTKASLGWLENFSKGAGPEKRKRELVPVLVCLRDARQNVASIMEQHLQSLVERLNIYKKQNKDKWHGKGGYQQWFWEKLPRDATWENIKRHFPYPDFAALGENKLARMKKEQLGDLLAQHQRLDRFDGVGSRPVDYAWVKEFDGLNNVAWVIEDLKQAYKKVEHSAFGKSSVEE